VVFHGLKRELVDGANVGPALRLLRDPERGDGIGGDALSVHSTAVSSIGVTSAPT